MWYSENGDNKNAYLTGQCHPVTVLQICGLFSALLLLAVCLLTPNRRHLADDSTAGALLVHGPCGVPLPAALVLTSSTPKMSQSLSVNKMQDIIIKCMMFIMPEGSKISCKNIKIHKIIPTKYDTKLHISTHIHTIKQ